MSYDPRPLIKEIARGKHARNLTREQEYYSFGKGGPLRETYLIGQNYTFGVSVNY